MQFCQKGTDFEAVKSSHTRVDYFLQLDIYYVYDILKNVKNIYIFFYFIKLTS